MFRDIGILEYGDKEKYNVTLYDWENDHENIYKIFKDKIMSIITINIYCRFLF